MNIIKKPLATWILGKCKVTCLISKSISNSIYEFVWDLTKTPISDSVDLIRLLILFPRGVGSIDNLKSSINQKKLIIKELIK